MPLNVPVTLTTPPIDRWYTVHTDRQRWSAEQLADQPDGRAALETAVREGVRKATSTCAYAGRTEPDIDTTEHPDGSVTTTGRLLCDEADCYSSAQRHHFDAAESIQAKAAADWVAQKELDLAPGGPAVVQKRFLSDHERHQRRASFGFVLAGVLCTTAGAGMDPCHYTKPAGTSPGTNSIVWFWTNVDSLCNTLAFPAVFAGTLLIMFGVGRLAVTNATAQ
ncbi:hypothetical protein AB0387_33565 [Streptomyces sp. NPDC089173]|uniref:hypothetical protein n=1 Tax=Streptomyces sp. NPDC089173 TaxID=3154965 RepID=UPI00344F3F9B